MWNLPISDPTWIASQYPQTPLVTTGYPFHYQPEAWGFGGEMSPTGYSVGHHLNDPLQKKVKKRRRSTNDSQRKAANIRERRRMVSLNESFEKLRTQVKNFLMSF